MSNIAHEKYLKLCFELAKQGLGDVSPNPMVGAVLVHSNSIIAKGWHKSYGGPHAEVNCLANVLPQDRNKVTDSTLYVSLEPCSHQGKTPPCTDLIIKHNIKRVVIANTDPNPLVAGKGIKKLLEAGIKVITGILEEEGCFVNRRFFTFHQYNRPYIILKWAQSADGFFTKDTNSQHWITGEAAKLQVHKWRYEEDAILVGTNTARVDNPQLTNRCWPGKSNPTRIVIDKNLSLNNNLKLFDSEAPTLVINALKNNRKLNIEWLKIDFDNNWIEHLLEALVSKKIQSLIVEGGLNILQQFIDADCWDEARVFSGTVMFGEGQKIPIPNYNTNKESEVGKDILRVYYKAL